MGLKFKRMWSYTRGKIKMLTSKRSLTILILSSTLCSLPHFSAKNTDIINNNTNYLNQQQVIVKTSVDQLRDDNLSDILWIHKTTHSTIKKEVSHHQEIVKEIRDSDIKDAILLFIIIWMLNKQSNVPVEGFQPAIKPPHHKLFGGVNKTSYQDIGGSSKSNLNEKTNLKLTPKEDFSIFTK